MSSTENPIILYTSRFCGHSRMVERFMKENKIAVNQINIDGNPEARSAVMAINNGYASVPTLVFPDGTTLTEPSFRQLRTKLNIEQSGLTKKLRRIFSGND